jgi:hypothetical protein
MKSKRSQGLRVLCDKPPHPLFAPQQSAPIFRIGVPLNARRRILFVWEHRKITLKLFLLLNQTFGGGGGAREKTAARRCENCLRFAVGYVNYSLRSLFD